MRRSFLLWLRLALSRSRRPALAAEAPVRPAGPLVWLVPDPGGEDGHDAGANAALLLRRLQQQRPGLTLLVSMAPTMAVSLPEAVLCIDPVEDAPAAVRGALGQWRPDLVVLMGNALPPALIEGTREAGVPVMLIDAHAPGRAARRGFFARRLQRALLTRLARISVRDPESQAALVRLGADPARIEVGGILSEPPEPLHCSETERASIASITRTRPVWLAAAVPAGEVHAVLTAHAQAQRHAHRMLLILAPDQPVDGTELVNELEAMGWAAGRRTLEGEPDDEMQIFLADDPGEYGLWYRIAPVTYMGGTLSGAAGHARSPLEPAALGSAVVHGPQTAPYGADYSRLDAARAARAIYDPRSLGDALADLIAPDRAAMLAHNAWAVTSGGAGAAEAVARAILGTLDAAATGEIR